MPEINYLEIGERPWGEYYVLIDEAEYKVKKLVVKPGKRLSLQSHEQRAEHWTIVAGKGLLEVRIDMDDESSWEKEYTAGEHCYIPKKAMHRISNPFDEDLVIIEVQCGSYTGEDDITRYEDDFGRA